MTSNLVRRAEPALAGTKGTVIPSEGETSFELIRRARDGDAAAVEARVTATCLACAAG